MTSPRYSQAGMQALKHGQQVTLTPANVRGMVPADGEAAYWVGDRIVPVRQAERLLAAVEATPPRHDCRGRLRHCDDHPGWRVFRRKHGTEWNAIPPGPETFPTPAEHVHASWVDAHGQVRAAQLAAITAGEGAGR